MNRSRPLWPLLTAALIGLPVLYVLSFGPVMWICRYALMHGVNEAGPNAVMSVVYAPLGWVAANVPEQFGYALYWYGHLFP